MSKIHLSATRCIRHFLCHQTDDVSVSIIDEKIDRAFFMHRYIYHHHEFIMQSQNAETTVSERKSTDRRCAFSLKVRLNSLILLFVARSYFSLHHLTFFCRFERVISSAIEISDSLFIIQESEMIRSRGRFSRAENRRRATENVKMNHHIDTKVKRITAKEQAFENSTLRALSQFERVQIEMTFIHDEMIDSTAELAVHRADSVSSRERGRGRERGRSRERGRGRGRRDREQAVSE
jgi:hypothetical protein